MIQNTTQVTQRVLETIVATVTRRPRIKQLVVRPYAQPGFDAWAESSGVVTLRLGRMRYPYVRPALPGGYRRVRFQNQQELLVYLLAHEWRHLWQWSYPAAKRLGGRGVSEVDADLYAIRCLERWRLT
jgi:hypothetical protein